MSTLLMLKDTVVMEFDISKGLFNIIHPELMPWSLRGYITPGVSSIELAINNNTAFTRWLSNRTIALSRRYAKDIYNLLGVDQLDTDANKARFALMFRAVSLLDSYWVKDERDPSLWCSVNLRCNKLNEIITQVALYGSSLSLQGSLVSPELSTNGSFAKAWSREDDGLYLHKRSHIDGFESDVEVMCSRLLDKMNVRHVEYVNSSLYGLKTCKCRLMSDESISIMPAVDMIYYTKANGLNYYDHVMRLDYTNICKMFIVDYLIANKDRHSQNWGFEYDSDTTDIWQCHKLFDHNLAFDKEYMENPDAMYKFNNKVSMRRAATKAKEQVDFHFIAPIERSDFITKEQYDCFMRRAEELHIETKEK